MNTQQLAINSLTKWSNPATGPKRLLNRRQEQTASIPRLERMI